MFPSIPTTSSASLSSLPFSPSSNTPAPISTKSTSTSVKRACDACHRRKVKCDGLSFCHNCSSSQIACTYNAIPQKKGPKGSRANVMSELRGQTRKSALSGKRRARFFGLSATRGDRIQRPPPCAPELVLTPGLLTQELMVACINFFFANMYPSCSILNREKLEEQARLANRDLDTYCLLTSLCAFIMLQPGMPVPGDLLGQDDFLGTNVMSGTMLMEETIECRKAYDHLESPTLASLVTSYFLFGCYFRLDIHTKAWFYLREATTFVHILGMNKEKTSITCDVIDSTRQRWLYWLLFTTERSYALQRHRPLTLEATIPFPTAINNPNEPSSTLPSFIHLITLFKPFDDKFVTLWNKARSDCSPDYLASLQKRLSNDLPSYLNGTESRPAELYINQQWLRNIVYHLSIANSSLSSCSDKLNETFQYPVKISRDFIAMATNFLQHSMNVHGVDLIEKLFEITCSLIEVLSLSPPPTDPFAPAASDYLPQFLPILSYLRSGGDPSFLDLLLAKIHDVLPRIVNPILQTLPEPSSNVDTATRGSDIFDGFGNAGLGMSSLPEQQHKQQGYDAKRYNEKTYENNSEVRHELGLGLQDQMLDPHAHRPQQQHHQSQSQQHCQHCQPTHHSIPFTSEPQQQSQQQQSQNQELLPPFQQIIQQALPYQSIHAGVDYNLLGPYALVPAPTTGVTSSNKGTSNIEPWV